MPQLKRSVVELKATEISLAHALIKAVAKVENGPDYVAYRRGYKILPVVRSLLDKTGIDLSGGGGIPELIKFLEHFRDYKITVYQSLVCEDIMIEEQVDSSKRINLLYYDIERHYHVIVKLTGALVRRYVLKHVTKHAELTTHTAVTKCATIVCLDLHAPFPPYESPAPNVIDVLNHACFSKHKQRNSSKKSICGALKRSEKHKCSKR